MKNRKILFLIPDGVGIRNYLYSDVIKQLKDKANISFWSPLPEQAFTEVKELHHIDIDYLQIKLIPENALTRLLRESATYARLLSNSKKVNNESILTNWNKENKSFKLKQLYKLAEKIGSWASRKYNRILWLERKSQKHWERTVIESYKTDLKKLNPTSVFITHQRVASLMPICIAAKELGIPVISAIYSWDNLPKARLAILANKYVVWSDYMKNEMATYYPEINSEDVLVTGTPQFEFYKQSERIISREEFAQQNGLNPDRKWICYSGDDIKTSPYDPEYLSDISEAVSRLDKSERPQLIFRRCPVDFSDRYDVVLQKHSDIIIPINPLWNTPKSGTNWGAVFPMVKDINMQVNLVYHCDFVVNLGSTMAHDFAMLNKPCFYYNYDPVVSDKWSVKTIYNFQHFRTMQNLDAVGWFNTKKEIFNKIISALQNPDSIGKDRLEWLKEVILLPVDKSSVTIAKLLSDD